MKIKLFLRRTLRLLELYAKAVLYCIKTGNKAERQEGKENCFALFINVRNPEVSDTTEDEESANR